MAYLSHGTFREFRVRNPSPSAALFLKSALIAIGAAAAVLGLSEASMVTSTSAQAVVALAKGDRLAAPMPLGSVGSSGEFVTDVAARTTVVAMGAAAPLSAESPMAGRN